MTTTEPTPNENRHEVVRLVDDSPLDRDQFEGHAHEAVAIAIAKVVTTEVGGRVIGLEGAWGSGKSTIVKLTTIQLSTAKEGTREENIDDVRVSVFDAWAHQGDPLRRTFLETLVDDLVKWEWLSPKEADDQKKKFTGKTTTTHTTTTPRLTAEGKITTASALLVPLGVTAFDNHFVHYHRLLIYLGLVLALAPVLVVTLMFLATEARKRIWHRETRKISFFAEEHEADTTTDSIESGEPTSVEFERFFASLLERAVTEKRRLLLVLDNLDRVSQGDARAIFATMQTFTSSTLRAVNESWRQRVWTLIPYDSDGLNRLWDAPGENEPASIADGASVSAAFLEKLFEIRFTTPPVVVSNWREYLAGLLAEALPEREDAEIQRVVRLRAVYPEGYSQGQVAKEQPTPRQLKQLVNAIGGIVRIRSDIPLVDVAYFCLMRRDGINLFRALVGPDVPNTRVAFLVTPEIRGHLAALLFGASVELGGQLLLRSPIEDAFTRSDGAALKSLSEQTGFAAVIDSIDLPGRAESGAVELTRIVSVLDDAELLTSAVLAGWIRDCLVPLAVLPTTSWKLATAESGRGLAAICELLPQDRARVALQRVQPISPDGAATAFAGLDAMAALCGKLGASKSLVGLRVGLEVPDDQLVTALAYFRSQTSQASAMEALQMTATPTAVSAAILPVVTSEAPQPALQALEVLANRSARFNSDSLLGGCVVWLQQSDSVNGEQLDAILHVVDILRAPATLVSVQQVADDGTLMHHLAFAHARGWMAAAANASMLFLVARPSTVEPVAAREAPGGITILRQALHTPTTQQPLVDAQTEWLSDHQSEAFELLWTQLSADPTALPWVNAQIAGLSGKSKLEVSAQQLVEQFAVLQGALGPESFEGLLAQVLATKESRALVREGSQDSVLALAALVASRSQPALADGQIEIAEWAATIIRDAASEQWSLALGATAGGPIIELALNLISAGSTPDAAHLDEAVRDHAEKLEAGEPVWAPPGEEFLRLTRLLSSASQRALAGHLVSSLEGKNGEIAPAFFVVYGSFLAEHSESRVHDKLPGVVARLVANEQWDAVNWFVALAKEHSDVLNRDGRKSAFEYLDEKVSERSGTYAEDAVPQALVALREVLGPVAGEKPAE